MSGPSFPHKDSAHFRETMRLLFDGAQQLSLFHGCKVYIFVDDKSGGFTFKSHKDHLWPPADQFLVSSNLGYIEIPPLT